MIQTENDYSSVKTGKKDKRKCRVDLNTIRHSLLVFSKRFKTLTTGKISCREELHIRFC